MPYGAGAQRTRRTLAEAIARRSAHEWRAPGHEQTRCDGMRSTGSRKLIVPRRTVIRLATLVLLLLVATVVGEAQPQSGKVPRIAVLTSNPMTAALQDSLRQGLQDHGLVEGQNIRVEWRAADGRADRAKILADELVGLKVDVIVAIFTPAVRAAREATSTIPIVMAPAGAPVATGFVVSLARPGGNITGIAGLDAELQGKRIELLQELVPGLTRVGLLINSTDPFAKPFVDEAHVA